MSSIHRHESLVSIAARELGALACVWLAAAVVFAHAPIAHAQESADSYDGLISEAVSEYDDGMWKEAHILFKRAHALKPSARTWYGIGISAFQAQRYVEAVEALSSALADTRKPLGSTQKRDAQSVLAKAQRFIGRVVLRVQPSEAAVVVDGAPIAASVLASREGVAVDPGTHEIVISASGYETVVRRLSVDGGDSALVELQLETKASSQSTAAAPVPGLPNAAEPEAASPEPRAEESVDSGSSRTLLWMGLIASSAVTIGGGVLLGMGLADAAAVEDAPVGTRWDEIESAHDRAGPLQTAGVIMLAAGGAGLALSTLLLLEGGSEETLAVQAVLTPNGVLLRGRL